MEKKNPKISSSWHLHFPTRVKMVSIGLMAIALNFLYHLIATSPDTKVSTAATALNGDAEGRASATCLLLRGLLGPIINLPSDSQYSTLRDENWSRTAWKSPSCIALPASTSEISSIVTTLVAANVSFAIRSGGHSPHPFDANINTGVLVAMDSMNSVTYDPINGLASFGAGTRWGAIYTALDPHNVTLVGGRVMGVGIGGLTLGGGTSYLSDLYGLVCDNVVSFEVVLADGRVVDATSSQNPDLFWALKGGGNNFGVLTKVTSKTYPLNQVWASVRTYNASQTPDVMQALYKYQTMPKKDLYTNMVLNLIPSNSTIILTLVYLKPVATPAAFAPFYKLIPATELGSFFTLHGLMGLFPPPSLPRWTWYSSNFQPDSILYAKISTLLDTAPEVAAISALPGGTLVGAAQPINANVALTGEAAGGNPLGLQAVNQTWFGLNAAWLYAKDDATVYANIKSLHDKVEALAKSANVDIPYISMNDANINQSVIASYGATNVQRLHAVQKVYDPLLVFQRLVTGGQKIPDL